MKKSFKYIAIIMLVFSVGMITIVYNVNGWYLAIPGPALFKWYEIFCFNMLGDIVFVGPIFLLGVGLLFFSNKKRKEQ